MIFAEILKELRVTKGLTHQELADKINYSRAIIGLWENGKREPTGNALMALSKFFEVSTDYLLGLEGESGEKYNVNNNNGHVFIKSNNNKVGDVGITKEELKIIKKIIDKAANDDN